MRTAYQQAALVLRKEAERIRREVGRFGSSMQWVLVKDLEDVAKELEEKDSV